MNIEQIKLQSGHIQKLAAKGAEHIATFKTYLVQKFPEHFGVNQTSPHRLDTNFYGLHLVFRIEMLWSMNTVSGRIVPYLIAENSTTETALGPGFAFDALGKVGNTYTKENFASYFLEDTFAALHKSRVLLRP